MNSATDDDIGEYIIFESSSDDDQSFFQQDIRHTYWFPEKRVKTGDLVVLYTKSGSDRTKKNKDGSTSHFFYWSLERPLWKRPNAAVVIGNLGAWTVFRPQSRPVDSES